jgi:hypothetical protein
MHHFLYKKKERKKGRRKETIKKKDGRYKNEKKNDKKTRKQKYIHMSGEPMAVLFSRSQYRMIKKCLSPE